MIEVLSVRFEGGFNVLSAPLEVCVECVNNADNRFPPLYVCGNRSSILSRVKGNFHVRRGFTIYQIMDILLDAYEETIFVEHDLMLFEDCRFHELEDFVMLLRQIGSGRLLIYLSPKRDRIFDFITTLADRYVYVQRDSGGYSIADVGRNGIASRFYPVSGQLTLEVF